jgi:hypothetical protein
MPSIRQEPDATKPWADNELPSVYDVLPPEDETTA